MIKNVPLRDYLTHAHHAIVADVICSIIISYVIVNMKKIVDYRKLLGVNEAAELQELKTIYRSLMKTWHPDKFQDESRIEAEEKSKSIIEAYHFLVSIAPETREQSLAAYEVTTNTGLLDFEFKSQVLTVYFADGNN